MTMHITLILIRKKKLIASFTSLNSGNIKTFLKEAFDPKKGFVKADGKIVNGLVRRRAREKSIFTKGNYGN